MCDTIKCTAGRVIDAVFIERLVLEVMIADELEFQYSPRDPRFRTYARRAQFAERPALFPALGRGVDASKQHDSRNAV